MANLSELTNSLKSNTEQLKQELEAETRLNLTAYKRNLSKELSSVQDTIKGDLTKFVDEVQSRLSLMLDEQKKAMDEVKANQKILVVKAGKSLTLTIGGILLAGLVTLGGFSLVIPYQAAKLATLTKQVEAQIKQKEMLKSYGIEVKTDTKGTWLLLPKAWASYPRWTYGDKNKACIKLN